MAAQVVLNLDRVSLGFALLDRSLVGSVLLVVKCVLVFHVRSIFYYSAAKYSASEFGGRRRDQPS